MSPDAVIYIHLHQTERQLSSTVTLSYNSGCMHNGSGLGGAARVCILKCNPYLLVNNLRYFVLCFFFCMELVGVLCLLCESQKFYLIKGIFFSYFILLYNCLNNKRQDNKIFKIINL